MSFNSSIKSFADMEKQRLAATPGPGHQSLRTPFVTLRLDTSQGSFEIPLLDDTRASGSIRQQGFEKSPQFLLLKNFSYEKEIRTGYANTCSITFIDPQWNYIDTFIQEIDQAKNRFSFTYGWRGIDDAESVAQTVVGFLVQSIDVQLIPFQGAQVTLNGIDDGYLLSFNPQQRGFDPKTPISEVITKVILDATGGVADVLITPIAQPVGVEHCRMENQTPIQYIQHLLHVAKSTLGSPSFRWDIKPATNQGRTQISITVEEAKLKEPPSRRYIYGREFDGRMISFMPRFLGLNLVSRGGGRVSGITVDPEKKTVLRLTSTNTEDAGHNPRKEAAPQKDSAIYEVPFDRDKTEAMIRKERERVDRYLYEATAVVYGDTGIQPLDNISIFILRGDAGQRGFNLDDTSLHKFGSGIFRVNTVTHTIQAGSFTTQLELYRNSGLLGPAAADLVENFQSSGSNLNQRFKETGVKSVVQTIA